MTTALRFQSARALAAALVLAALSVLTGCEALAGLFQGPTINPPPGSSTYQDLLYITDTTSGKVFTWDPLTKSASTTSLAAVTQNGTGALAFHSGIGWAAVGFGGGAGVYYFDPSAASPTFTKVPGAVNAQYFAFGPTTAYVTNAGDYNQNTGGLYTFDPAGPQASLVGPMAGTDKYLQDVVVGADGKVYASALLDGAVLVVDPAASNSVTTKVVSAAGTTGLLAGTFDGIPGVFVASNGNYAGDGAIDFIKEDGSVATVVTAAGFTPSRVLQLPNGNLVATGYGHTWLVTVSGTTASVAELKAAGDESFGSLDIAMKDGLVYVPVASTSDYLTYSNKLYAFDTSGIQASWSPASLMGSTDAISNLAFYQ